MAKIEWHAAQRLELAKNSTLKIRYRPRTKLPPPEKMRGQAAGAYLMRDRQDL